MTIEDSHTECGECGSSLKQARTIKEAAAPCSNCGSRKRIISVSVVESVVVRDGYGTKAKRVGQKKPFVESLSVPSHSRKLDKFVHHQRLIDRDNDLYYEKVTEYETGAVLHERREPLSQHIGHGSDKKAKVGDA